MAASGEYSPLFKVADMMMEACERAGLDPAEFDTAKIQSARRSLNLVLRQMEVQDADNKSHIDAETISLVAGTATYDLPAGSIDVIDAKHVDSGGTDRFMSKITRQEYWHLPNTTSQGVPSMYWVDLSSTGDPETDVYTITVYPTPSAAGTLNYWRLRQIQNVTALNQHVDVGRFYEEAVVAAWSAALARKYNVAVYPMLRAEAFEAYRQAQMEAHPRVPIVVAARGYGRSRKRRI
jgi:hypothetical protein